MICDHRVFQILYILDSRCIDLTDVWLLSTITYTIYYFFFYTNFSFWVNYALSTKTRAKKGSQPIPNNPVTFLEQKHKGTKNKKKEVIFKSTNKLNIQKSEIIKHICIFVWLSSNPNQLPSILLEFRLQLQRDMSSEFCLGSSLTFINLVKIRQSFF